MYRKVAAPCTDYNTTCFTARVTMFVKYLHDRDLQSYQRFLKAISQGTPFRDAVEILGGSTEHLWRQFIEDLK